MCNPNKSGSAIPTQFINNDRTLVTEWRFENKGDNTEWHKHDYDYVVVPLFDGVLNIKNGKGEITQAELKNGVPYFRQMGVEHDVINGNDFECAFVEIEIVD